MKQVPGLTLALTIACVALGSGCRSVNKPASASFASVVIAGLSMEQIEETATAVFQADGYAAFRTQGGQMVFEKEGTQKDQIAYAGVVGAHYGERVSVRVRTEIVDLGVGTLRLQCRAYIVRNAGQSFSEEEVPLLNMKSRPYQKLLDEVARRLK